jgi:single-strand DNA-binding protein
MNTTTITGKAWEPNTRYSQSGTCITDVSVSVYDGKDQEGKAKYFSVKCVGFKELAENMGNQIVKGDNVIVVGKISEEKWEKDGVTNRRMTMIVDAIGKEISRFSGDGNKPAPVNGYNVSSFGTEVFPEENIPF